MSRGDQPFVRPRKKAAATKVRAPARNKPTAPRRSGWQKDPQGVAKRLVAAFDRIVRREGFATLTVDHVVREAGVGKSALYNYFGGVAGLAREWGRSTQLVPSPEEIIGGAPVEFKKRDLASQFNHNLQGYAQALRARPTMLQVMAYELFGSNDITKALGELRDRMGTQLRTYFPSSVDTESEDAIAVSVVMVAALNYLMLRAASGQAYYGMRLDRADDWAKVQAMMERIVNRMLANP
jgi:AcrR family transcriptional regulator